MSGQIINPFSSDFNPINSISYSTEPIPVVAYCLIGITSLTLAYVTLIDSTQRVNAAAKQASLSATSMLPSIGTTFGLSSKPESPSMQVSPFTPTMTPSSPVEAQVEVVNNEPPMAEAVPITPEKPAVGGKTKRRKHKNKKTKRRRVK